MRKFQKRLSTRVLTEGNQQAPNMVSVEAPSPFIMMARVAAVQETNKNLDLMKEDYLYHLGLTKQDAWMFREVQYVVMGGLNERMTKFAH